MERDSNLSLYETFDNPWDIQVSSCVYGNRASHSDSDKKQLYAVPETEAHHRGTGAPVSPPMMTYTRAAAINSLQTMISHYAFVTIRFNTSMRDTIQPSCFRPVQCTEDTRLEARSA